ncbi:uncharacterized protein LAESUDRAFT_697655 [Laetiporus sulphureus 93-53]|uniref:Jacalin-type lectin domain-containing protein n=1 Tax=Laetiporus sulphureus 93-53 TaxID=1314785 RepID=A0A165F195_9APHY|nr:uncharacterized protein LAESUDRAFT_697655 [Laetiporus sulphureus 93-53]KZT08156.1 hypothetical protein LAESUDRAFT_697655 [Laetiporus sulphureus 93-53]
MLGLCYWSNMGSKSAQVAGKILRDLLNDPEKQQSTVAIAACTTLKGDIHCYVRTHDGVIEQRCLEQCLVQVPVSESEKTHVPQTGGWKPGDFRHECSPKSQLSGLAWGSGRETLFYQHADNTIREARYDSRWYDTNFAQADVMPGTRIAAVCTPDGLRAMLFFQDSEGYICYRRAWSWNWEANATRLVEAAPFSPLTVKLLNRKDDADYSLFYVYVFYQDQNLVLREQGTGTFGEKWFIGDFVEDVQRPVSSLATNGPLGKHLKDSDKQKYSDGSAVKILYNDPRALCIKERIYVPWEWKLSQTVCPAPQDSCIAACAYVSDKGIVTNLFWASHDSVIHHHVWTPQLHWVTPSVIEYDMPTRGSKVGPWKGAPFDDESHPISAWRKVIKMIDIRSYDAIDGMALGFTDGSYTDWRGGYGGRLNSPFELCPGENITQVLVHFDNDYIRAVRFRTSRGRESGLFGRANGAPSVLCKDGKVLAGFIGTTGIFQSSGNTVLTGLQPLWRDK